MQRTVTMPADVSGRALADLKGWLGISRPDEDDLLIDLLCASLAICEGFTGQAPIEQTIEETVPAIRGWHCLTSRPVRSVLSLESVAVDGTRTQLAADAFGTQIEANGTARIELKSESDAAFVAVSIRSGLATEWDGVPGALKQGMIRLAAFNYRDRETDRDAAPPASVSALWRPWRVLRLT